MSATMEDTDDVEEWAYLQLHDNTHLLHAVIHSNGFAHLLTLNGRQGGSTLLSGRHILDLWDRLCQTLSVRSIIPSLLAFTSSHCQNYNHSRCYNYFLIEI